LSGEQKKKKKKGKRKKKEKKSFNIFGYLLKNKLRTQKKNRLGLDLLDHTHKKNQFPAEAMLRNEK